VRLWNRVVAVMLVKTSRVPIFGIYSKRVKSSH
jgi:hypothetical protein